VELITPNVNRPTHHKPSIAQRQKPNSQTPLKYFDTTTANRIFARPPLTIKDTAVKFDRLLQLLLPRTSSFYDLFDKSAANVLESGRVFRKMLDASPSERKGYRKQLEDLEHRGDEITHTIYNELSTTFITPIDREDIHGLASSLDDIVDMIEAATLRMELYNITTLPSSVIALADVLIRSIEEVSRVLPMLSDMRNEMRIREGCVRVNSYENQADTIYHQAIADLFNTVSDAIEIIKVKELLNDLETATDKCEQVANLLENILLKHA